MNQLKTAMLMALLVAIFMAVGFLIGGTTGMLIALLIAAAMNFFSYWNSDKVVLKMHKAREVGPEHAFFQLVEPLAAQAGVPMPRVYLIDQPQPNAFATGRDPEHAAVAATTGLLNALNPDEVAAVMAHEIAHVKNRDTLLMTMTATLAGATTMLGNFAFFSGGNRNGRSNPLTLLLAIIGAPFAAGLVRMAISRTREYGADAKSAEMHGKPRVLASALINLDAARKQIANPVAQANPFVAPLYIVNPLNGGLSDSLFSTHPTLESRVAALEAIAEAQANAGG